MELSVNSIVILVIAIVIMGLILAFVRSKFTDLSSSLEQQEPDAATAISADPISLSRTTIGATPGATAVIKTNVMNVNGTSGTVSVFIPGCNAFTGGVMPKGIDKIIAPGSTESFVLTLTVPGTVAKGTYLCAVHANITASGNTGEMAVKDIVIKVQ